MSPSLSVICLSCSTFFLTPSPFALFLFYIEHQRSKSQSPVLLNVSKFKEVLRQNETFNMDSNSTQLVSLQEMMIRTRRDIMHAKRNVMVGHGEKIKILLLKSSSKRYFVVFFFWHSYLNTIVYLCIYMHTNKIFKYICNI